MKFKLQLWTATALLLLLVSAATAPAQSKAGMPAGGTGVSTIDPTTGLPVAPPEPLPDWKDPDWKDPDLILTNVVFDGVPVSQVASFMRDQFKSSFDVLLPVNGNWNTDWKSLRVQLRMKNVSASEIFYAMNLMFENDRTPLRWELKANGRHPLALLRVLEDPLRHNPQDRPDPPRRAIQYVGDMVGSEKSGGLTMDQIVSTVNEVWTMTYGKPSGIQFHKDAQLLIVTGDLEQIDFVQHTIRELRAKVETDRKRLRPAEPKPKAGDAKPAAAPGGE